MRDRRGETLFIDARKMGRMIDRVHRELTIEDIQRIASTYHAWRGDQGASEYADIAGFCKSAKFDEIRAYGHVLTPGRYVGAEDAEDDGVSFEETMKQLTAKLEGQFAESAKLELAIKENLKILRASRANVDNHADTELKSRFDGLVATLMQVRRDEQPLPSGDYMRLLIARVLSYRLEIRTREDGHNYPHFHVTCPNGDASYRIDNQERLAGEIPRRHEKEIQRWAKQNQALLETEWTRLRPVLLTREHTVTE